MPLFPENSSKPPEAAVADYLEYAIQHMRKRAWDLDEDGNVFEHRDGSIPIWWLRQEIDRLRLTRSPR